MFDMSGVEMEDATSWEQVSLPEETNPPAQTSVAIILPNPFTDISLDVTYGNRDIESAGIVDDGMPRTPTPVEDPAESIAGPAKLLDFKWHC